MDKITEAFEKRLAIYRMKRDEPHRVNREYDGHEALTYVIEAIELLAFEAGINITETENVTNNL